MKFNIGVAVIYFHFLWNAAFVSFLQLHVNSKLEVFFLFFFRNSILTRNLKLVFFPCSEMALIDEMT
uniref:Uncharacterized protein n=1 Tax=Nelumbo nucifera TaxID=4432 RepID=A0A822XV32_NELNU|nr:TPA_asm: hypothetical protein HUJ06_025066 [Nelumbo nucifera]